MKKIINGLLILLTSASMPIVAYHNPLQPHAAQTYAVHYRKPTVEVPAKVTTVAPVTVDAPAKKKKKYKRKRKGLAPYMEYYTGVQHKALGKYPWTK